MGKTVALSELVKMGGTRNQLLTQISKEIWEDLLDEEITGDYFRVPPRSLQQGGRHAITNRGGFKQAEIKSSGVSIPLENLMDPRHRPFCFPSFTSSSNLCVLETGSRQQRQRCFSLCWTHTKGYAFPHFL